MWRLTVQNQRTGATSIYDDVHLREIVAIPRSSSHGPTRIWEASVRETGSVVSAIACKYGKMAFNEVGTISLQGSLLIRQGSGYAYGYTDEGVERVCKSSDFGELVSDRLTWLIAPPEERRL